VIIHEVFHGLAADALGDPTARLAGRLSLNPLRHLDPIGSIFVPLFLIFSGSHFIFGWAKPVPVNPLNLKDQKYGYAKVAIAGPASNLAIALFFGLAMRFLPVTSPVLQNFYTILSLIVYINILLAIFNLIPIPPLDGSHILFTFLPASAQNAKIFLQRYGIFILLLFVFLGFQFVLPIIFGLYKLIVGAPMVF
jgi:Zn-dependent protease